MSESRVYRFFAVLIVLGLAVVIFLKLFGLHETVFWRDFWCSFILFVLACIIWDCGNTGSLRAAGDVLEKQIRKKGENDEEE